MNEQLLIFIKNLAESPAAIDDSGFNPCDYSGGNYDDAYYMGSSDGGILLAREILKRLSMST